MGRIVFLSSHHGTGASESLWIETATRMAKQGWEVRAAVCWVKFSPVRVAALQEAGVKVHWLFQPGLLWRLKRKLRPSYQFHLREIRRLAGSAAETSLVLVSQGNDHSCLPWLEACHDAGLKAAVVTHGISAGDWPSDHVAARLGVAFSRLCASFWVSRRNQFDFELQIGVHLPHGSLAWNPIKIPVGTLVPWPTSEEPWKIACVARMQARPKGHDLLLQALALPHWQARPLHVSFFGAGENQNGMERLADLLGIRDRVHFFGHVDNVENIWREHHMVAQPSRNEGMPMSLVEALMCGRPALVTDVAGHTELITDGVNGFVAEAPTVRHIDAALQRAWARREQWHEMGDTAAKQVRTWVPTDPIQTFADSLLAAASGL